MFLWVLLLVLLLLTLLLQQGGRGRNVRCLNRHPNEWHGGGRGKWWSKAVHPLRCTVGQRNENALGRDSTRRHGLRTRVNAGGFGAAKMLRVPGLGLRLGLGRRSSGSGRRRLWRGC